MVNSCHHVCPFLLSTVFYFILCPSLCLAVQILISSGTVQHERLPYIVTHWESGLLGEVTFTKGDTLRRFLISVGIVFKTGPVSRLYALYPGKTHEQRVRIESTEALNEVLEAIDGNAEYLEILYVYPDDKSPTTSPSKTASPPNDEAADKSDASSVKSDRSTYQKRFKKELLRRDHEKCLLCQSEDALIGAHIVDAEAKLSSEERVTLDMSTASDRYAVYNGLLLCANCHTMYDNWQLGVDDDGYLIKWDKNSGWVKDQGVNVYSDPSDKKSSPRNPWSVLLKWKYDRFVSKRNKTSTKLYNGVRSLFSSPIKPKKK